MHKQPFFTSSLTSSKALEIVFSDVWTSPITSFDNYKYYVLFVDHYTRYTWLHPLKRKSQVKDIFPKFKELVETRFQSKLQTLYSDNGGEFIALTDYLFNHGISHFTSPPHTPEHNGMAERKHRHIVETGLTLLSHASMPHSYWTFALAAAVYLINRMPTPTISMMSPFETLFGNEPNYSKLKVFGCLCFPWLQPYNSHKLDSRSKPCVFIGYSTTQSAYFCLDRNTSRIYTTRHVFFHEYVFPFLLTNKISSSSFTSSENADSTSTEKLTINTTSTPPPTVATQLTLTITPTVSPHTILTADASPPLIVTTPPTTQNIDIITTPTPPTTSNPPIPAPTSSPHLSPAIQIQKSTRQHKPIQKLNLTAATQLHSHEEPTTVAEALKDERWGAAMCSKNENQVHEQTWE